ncbi:energy-coupling factor transport system substrate-specific component [Hydrogenoanaerobacterium saccharovorans]|uniref:Energy-coupling factor transport system substrate-specific component n=1 Tax=Hydrogenoanaerobacterium saccharovorans TaxID=474960 RepID=A0A1H7ZI48_9FIRM|nr:BMC domain-containing protein [Hydrogenoanaerobacterium saccharovorans]RPF48587.1 energy-coupling factor transport system substrate-specific component [Hydrogenoanaerobacterium saccharovorans]SEM57921.1 energy-coupling factor transport system substrate-specific component [Hydrogenoanaerobacterium saccharovorans]
MKALGMIEVYGYLSAVEALDSALKAANVNLLSVTKVRGGLVTVMVTGDVGAVKASMDASAAAASRVGKVVSVHVIPRPASDIENMLSSSSKPPQPPSDIPPPKRQEPVMPAKNEPLSVNEPEQMKQNVQPEQTDLDNAGDMETVDLQSLTRENMADMKVVKLREIARALNLKSMSKKEIRFAKKEELIERICEFQNRRDD